MFHAGTCRVFRTVFPLIDIQQALIQHTQCPCRFVILATKKLCSHKLRDRHIFTSQMQQDTRHIPYAVNSRVWRLGCFSGAWRRGSWHFQVASLHFLQSIMNHFVRFTLFSFLSKRSGRRMPPAERSALYYIHTWYLVPGTLEPKARERGHIDKQ